MNYLSIINNLRSGQGQGVKGQGSIEECAGTIDYRNPTVCKIMDRVVSPTLALVCSLT